MTDEPTEEQPTEAAKPAPKPGLKDGRQNPTYRVLQMVNLTSDRQTYRPGQIVDLSHLPQASIRYFLDRKVFETADGEPANVPGNPAPPCKNC